MTAVRWTLAALDTVSPRLAGRLAYALYFHVRRRKPSANESAQLARASKSYVTQDGLRLPVYVWGSEHPKAVLLIHGWEGYGGQFADFIPPLLSAGFRVVAFDAPGHGAAPGSKTNTKQMKEVARTLVAKHGPFVAVIAHSFGAMVASAMLKEVGDGFRQAVFISGVFGCNTLLATFQSMTGAGDGLVRQIVERTERALKEPWDAFTGETLAPAQRVPALIIHDNGDRDVPPREAERYAAAWPNAQLVWTEGLGHRRILKDKDVITRAVAAVSR